MTSRFRDLPIDERISLVEDLWDSIALEQQSLPLTEEQIRELDRRLDAFDHDRNQGRVAADAVTEIRKRL